MQKKHLLIGNLATGVINVVCNPRIEDLIFLIYPFIVVTALSISALAHIFGCAFHDLDTSGFVNTSIGKTQDKQMNQNPADSVTDLNGNKMPVRNSVLV